MTIKSKIIGYYDFPFKPSSRKMSLEDVIKEIKSDFHKSKIDKCRSSLEKGKDDEYKDIKKTLPAVTFCGDFPTVRKSEYISSYSGLIVFDIDDLDKHRVELIKNKLITDEYVIAAWTSPSNLGIKFLIYTDCDSSLHKPVFKSAKEYFENKYSIQIDKSGSDVSRLCFLSYDPNLLVDFEKSSFNKISDPPLLKPDRPLKRNPKEANLQINNSLLFKNDGKNSKRDKRIIKDIYHFLKKRALSITEDYDSWVRIAFVMSALFTFDVASKLFLDLCRLDGIKHDEQKSLDLLKNCYAKKNSQVIQISTIVYLAKNKGFILKGKLVKH